jgi:hypothetical protein
MKYQIIRIALILFTLSSSAFAQDSTSITKKKKLHGSFYFTWGYNRDAYTKSTIRFVDHTTDDYDFKLIKAKAHDQPDFEDLFNRPISVPQYQWNIGYMFNNKSDLGIELSWDHLKYVMNDYQTVHVIGDIRGQHIDQDSLITPDFVKFEHTNGNNYLMGSLLKRFKLFSTTKKMHQLSLFTKAGAGLLIPKTDSYIMGKHNDGPFRVSGYVVGVAANIRYDFLRFLFIETGLKGCFAHYTNAKVYEAGRARHHFFSVQYLLSFGINIPLTKEM